MRLLDTQTGQFREIAEPTDVPYAILSHRWDIDGEQTYQEVCAIQAEYRQQSIALVILRYLRLFPLGVVPHSPPSYPATRAAPLAATCMVLAMLWTVWATPLALAWASAWAHYPALTDHRLSRKIRDACVHALANGHRYLWIDSCCIDKTSSTELSESINSMYRWYELADVCFAYLSDVPGPGLDPAAFRNSEWHDRGWTLQELLAPDVVVFLSARWEFIGTKSSLVDHLGERLHINTSVLTKHTAIRELCAAQVMAWAVLRKTTREEDMAYCLMGLFGVHIPTLYGEGGRRAFIRLQQEIWHARHDPSIFAWNHSQRPIRVENLAEYGMRPGFDEGSTTIVRSKEELTYLHDYASHYATHPLDFRIGSRVTHFSSDLCDSDTFASSFWNAAFAHSGWTIPLSHGSPSPVPHAPLSALLPSDTLQSPTLSNFYLVVLPCLWESSSMSEDTNGLLAIVCSLRTPPRPTLPDTKRLSTVLQPETLHRSNNSHPSRLVLLTAHDLHKLNEHILLDGSLYSDPFHSHPPRSVDVLRRSKAYHTNMTANVPVRPRIQPPDWVVTVLSAQGYEITRPLLDPLLPAGIADGSEDHPISELKLRKEHLSITIQYKPPSTLSEFGMVWFKLPLRVGLEVLHTGQDDTVAAPVAWTKWKKVELGLSKVYMLKDPRDGNVFFCRVALRFHLGYDHRLIIDVYPSDS